MCLSEDQQIGQTQTLRKSESKPDPVEAKNLGKLYAMNQSEVRSSPHMISSEVVVVKLVCRDWEAKIEDVTMKVDLIMSELDEFEVILGIDFLTKYHTIFDCSNKEARRLMKKGHVTYIAHVADTQTSKSDPSRVPVVYEYLMCF
ncbi:uncharacterized protein E5676_scaffold745G00020 [Cucumis melo var. makuwa]|uniref:Uncharacterized protein n=1 Tax=Cucumis melo var. makuwa TaxID=1194695 RepID=A0A5D3CNR0_CUCMM|nr:uncharacterized protein E6C27_scaffold219G001260 [Cucumis melo var. makuwa]TYK13507.1 uncharacterized protein E5676_scaffold745G00020 [Cucumis melo var. makuwa]